MLHQLPVSNKHIESKPNMANKKLQVKSLESIENEDARFHMISEAAYYRALGRGFDGGDHVQDGLVSEVAVNGLPLDHT